VEFVKQVVEVELFDSILEYKTRALVSTLNFYLMDKNMVWAMLRFQQIPGHIDKYRFHSNKR